MEGAGSVTELNLKKTDRVNPGLATRLNVPVMLRADIDRGGVFAAIIGTFALLEVTTRPVDAAPFAVIVDGHLDGARIERCAGTYLHGALKDPQVLGELPGRSVAAAPSRETTYEALTDWFEA
jgi:adenosylcobyric acid synthase